MSSALGAAARHRVMYASSQVNPKDNREAAILGGIVRTALDHNSFMTSRVRAHVVTTLPAFSSSKGGRKAPTDDEIAAMSKRFMYFYKQDPGGINDHTTIPT